MTSWQFIITPSASVARTLLDHNLPRPLARLLVGHDVRTTAEEGWAKLSNGILLKTAEDAGFAVFVTGDQNLAYQNNLDSRRMSLVVLSEIAWPVIRHQVAPIRAAIEAATPGSYREVKLRRAPKRGGRHF